MTSIDTRSTALIAAGIIVAISCVAAALWIISNDPRCSLGAPLACEDVRGGPDGAMLTIINLDAAPLRIGDVTVSRRGGPTCIYPRDRRWDTISGESYLRYFITREHPDGACLLEGMEPGKSYGVVIDVVLVTDDGNRTISGRGTLAYDEENVYR